MDFNISGDHTPLDMEYQSENTALIQPYLVQYKNKTYKHKIAIWRDIPAKRNKQI
jgi:hypothetical protein